jgi:cell division septation protein DedD
VRKILIFCLYCVIFTLIPAVSILAQGRKDKSKNKPFPASEAPADDSDTFYISEPDPADEDEFFIISDNAVTENSPSAPEIPAVNIDSRTSVETGATVAAEPAAPVVTAPPQPLPPQSPLPQPPQPTVNPYGADYGLQAPAPPPPPPQAPSRSPPQPPIRTIGPTVNIILPPAVPPAAPPAAPSAAPPAYRSSINVIPGMPDPYGHGVYRVQLGAFSNTGLAEKCFNRLKSAGFTPYYEQFGSLYRVVITGVTAADMAGVVQRLEAAGFSEAWIREER